MQRLSSLTNPPRSTDFLSTLHHVTHTLFTPRYIGFVGGGILLLLFIAAAVIENSTKTVPVLQHSNTSSDSHIQNNVSTDNLPSADSSQTKTHLQVNGQEIPVPSSSDTTQTLTSGDTRTVVHTSENSSQSSNNNSSNLTINVDSVTSGGT
jgi:hypothetical protein